MTLLHIHTHGLPLPDIPKVDTKGMAPLVPTPNNDQRVMEMAVIVVAVLVFRFGSWHTPQTKPSARDPHTDSLTMKHEELKITI